MGCPLHSEEGLAKEVWPGTGEDYVCQKEHLLIRLGQRRRAVSEVVLDQKAREGSSGKGARSAASSDVANIAADAPDVFDTVLSVMGS